MDRDKRWERTKLAFDAIVHSAGPSSSSVEDVVRNAYAAGTTDEFIMPTVILDAQGSPTPLKSGDAVISFNYRSDRMRQLIAALSESEFNGFDRGVVPTDLEIVTMTRYEEGLPVEVAFAPKDVVNPVSRVISDAGLAQFHSAETEKYPHVTFFFNGGREDAFPREERAMVPSPKVSTYDLQPEMSADGVTQQVVNAIDSGAFNFIIVNFANGDMVGHTGVFNAAVKAVETADRDLGRILEALERAGGVAIVTADHGNAEEMIDRATGGPMTAHTTNPVPVILISPVGDSLRTAHLREGAVLSSVAPTILELLGIDPPLEMDQASLIVPKGS
jgi:2,3-bisphosphoglycerate-independent phosphoglycerate mutase